MPFLKAQMQDPCLLSLVLLVLVILKNLLFKVNAIISFKLHFIQ